VKSKVKTKSTGKRKTVALARKSAATARTVAPPPRSTHSASRKNDVVAETGGLEIPRNVENTPLNVDGGPVNLTNLTKIYFPELGLTKRDLLQYYLDVSPWLLPHLQNRAMVMKRYPNGINGEFFFMKRAPSPRPDSIRTCSIEHGSGNVIDFPVIQHLSSLLWVVNLGCIDLNP
jgi:bifunctional non-homologous end joining protein LigD